MTSSAARLRLFHAGLPALLVLLALMPLGAAHGQAAGSAGSSPTDPPGTVQTVLKSRNQVVLGLSGKPASLTITIRSISTGHRLEGNASFELSSEGEPLEKTDSLTCAASLSFGCGVVARFSTTGRKAEPPSVYEAQLQDGVLTITAGVRKASEGKEADGKGAGGKGSEAKGTEVKSDFESFVAGIIDNTSVAVKVRVDQQQEFLFDLQRLAWPLADIAPDHPFSARFAGDPVLAGLKQRFPSRYLKIVDLVRKLVPDAGTLTQEAETRILESIHAAVGSLRPMVPDELLERIVANAAAAARQVGSGDLPLCNALAVAARSPLTVPGLKDSAVARAEYALWHEVIEQAHPRFIRKVPNDDLLPSTPTFEENMRVANESGCGMFAAVIEAILKLPREERRLWLRATVGTVEDLRAEAPPSRR
ncbi:MAG: hypothetical protein H0T52_14055 [Lautropia sp.]|nr:hypothetical protein [Lautropia sp.]